MLFQTVQKFAELFGRSAPLTVDDKKLNILKVRDNFFFFVFVRIASDLTPMAKNVSLGGGGGGGGGNDTGNEYCR